MKQPVLFKFITLGLIVPVLFTAYCAKSAGMSDSEVITHLAGYFNSRMYGSQFKIDPTKTIVKPMGNNRYHITLKNTPFITDLTGTIDVIIKNLSQSDEGQAERNEYQMEEVTLIYGPKDQYLKVLSIKGMSIDGNFTPSQQKNPQVFGGVDLNKIQVSVGKITFGDQDTDNTGTSETIEHLKLQLSGLTARQENILVIMDIEKIGKVDTGKEDDKISKYLLDKNALPPDLKNALETGAAINDLNVRLGKINISIKKNGSNLCEGTIEDASYMQFMKPDRDRKYFTFGNGLRIRDLELKIPSSRELQLLSNVKEFQFDYSVNNLSPEAVQVFLDIVKNSFSSRNQINSTNGNELPALVTKFLIEVIKTKVDLRFSISPFRHYFGEMEAEVSIRLYNLMAGPVLTFKATVFKVEEVLKKFREAGVFSEATLKAITGFIDKYGNKKENGAVTFLYEMDVNQLREMLSKGNSLVPPTTF
ncbi:MAG TPA: hypothetical protein VK186_17160 [Candidatus Deferrimicrobium sp.]|nr:hypothetical protein [Candidatus Kapabacteria bacterium]HLP60574.1 hypothetical protein [Candidatus Deferrimicrobium sp.]